MKELGPTERVVHVQSECKGLSAPHGQVDAAEAVRRYADVFRETGDEAKLADWTEFRWNTDPLFHAIVTALETQIEQHGYTSDELIAAVRKAVSRCERRARHAAVRSMITSPVHVTGLPTSALVMPESALANAPSGAVNDEPIAMAGTDEIREMRDISDDFPRIMLTPSGARYATLQVLPYVPDSEPPPPDLKTPDEPESWRTRPAML